MAQGLRNGNILKHAGSVWKVLLVLGAFLAFCLNMRQKDLDRFHTIKPLFEIDTSTATAKSFSLLNYGGIVYFIGCDEESVGKFLTKTPRQFSTLRDKQPDKQPVEFEFS